MGGIGIWQLVIVLLIVFLLFGTKRLKGLGSDVGEAIQGFRKSMGGDSDADTPGAAQVQQPPLTSQAAAQPQPHADRQA
ncbi:twin-arginine translocase TatA/TatE family subunit [Pseudomonas sp. P39-UII1]|uniref:twin-arginine translocase TatA/TatE family subunit n=1 Tax=unclassified Pseudomonas TaxID=196821 RepID=UPI00320849A9